MKPPFPDVAVLLGDPRLPDATKVDAAYSAEDLEAVQRLKNALSRLTDYRFTYLDNHEALFDVLRRHRPSFVLNLGDTGYRNVAAMELHLPALLEMLEVPYSGAPPACLARCYDKGLVRALAGNQGVPVPKEYYLPAGQTALLPDLYPALLKPNTGDGSYGITQHALVRTRRQARDYLGFLQRELGDRDILWQEFLEGREIGLCLIGNPGSALEALPAMEVDYAALDDGLPRILSYESKTVPDSPYWSKIRYHRADLSPDVQAEVLEHCRLMFRRLGCRDYARFDFRAGADDVFRLLEVNPNPAWCWDGKMMLMGGFAGHSESDVLRMILQAAQDRYR